MAAFGPEPVFIGKWSQPAAVTTRQQRNPSLTTLLPAARSRLARVAISFFLKPLTIDGKAVDPVRQEPVSAGWPVGVSLSRLGLRSAVVSTAATNGVLPAAPRPRLPPGRCPPR